MNCGMSSGFQAFCKITEAEYQADTTRAVLINNPLESFFKMKSGATAAAFLENLIQDVRVGDIVTVDFEVMTAQKNCKVTVEILEFGSVITRLDSGDLYFDSSEFEKGKMRFVLKKSGNVLINVRLNTLESEAILKNINVQIDTSNYQLSVKNQLIVFDKAKMLECVSHTSQSNVRNAYAGLKTLFEQGLVTINDNEIVFSNAGTNNFKGLVAHVTKEKNKRLLFTAFFEARKVTNSNIVANGYDGYVNMSVETRKSVTNESIEYKKFLIYSDVNLSDCNRVFAEIGNITSNPNANYRNVMFNFFRIDDGINEEINRYQNLFK